MSLEELDEHERSERVREWVRKNAGSIALGILAGVGAIYGFEQWRIHRDRTASLAGDEYRAYAEALARKDSAAASTLGKSVRDKFPDSPYAALTALNDAASFVSDGKIDAAIESLKWAEANATMPELKILAKLRRARLLLAMDRPEEALALSSEITVEGFKTLAAEIRGDALLALKRPAEARAAYDEALVGFDSGAARRAIVEMKRDDLVGSEAES